MKNLLPLLALTVLFASCQKITDVEAPLAVAKAPTSMSSQGVENLGHLFSGTNVNWRIHPFDPSNSPLFTYPPNQTSGFVMLMIDNNNYASAPLKFIAVDLQKNTSKTIRVQKLDGSYVQNTLGRVSKYTFGMDKNFYVATEGGGHLIQYNPNTQTAVDLGQPFKNGDSQLDIYTLNVGIDSALYGGSFGGAGEVMTFRYKDNKFSVQQTPLDSTSRYVVYISGDKRYTYSICGKNNWFLYAVDRETGAKKTLISNAGSSLPISIASTSKTVFAGYGSTLYKLNGFDLLPPDDETPVRVEYVPYYTNDQRCPQVYYDDTEKKVYYKLASGLQGEVAINDVSEDVYRTNHIKAAGDKIYITGAKSLATFTPGVGYQVLGKTSMDIYSIDVPSSTTANPNKLYLSGYPKGGLLEYSINQSWSVNFTGFSLANFNGGFASSTTNPKLSTYFQDADANGVNGAMTAVSVASTKNGYVVTGGNNDRITTSSSREFSIGNYKNGVTRNVFKPEFSSYEFQALCLSSDSLTVFAGGKPKNGNAGKIFKYDPATNSILATYDLPLWSYGDYSLSAYDAETLVGRCDDMVFLFDLKSGKIIWQQILGSGQKIFSLAIGPDHSVYIMHMCLLATNFRLMKYTFDTHDRTSITYTANHITDLRDEDNDERCKPVDMVFAPIGTTGVSNLYVSGFNSLYRVKI
jgi:hypothetical protein